MSNIEPTEEQRRAAAAHCLPVDGAGNPPSYTEHWVKTGQTERGLRLLGPVALARLFAEREAKLRARVAELEALFAAATSARVADKMENLKREAQHLADIKATIDLLRNPFAPHIERVQLLQRLAHYDDAKADAPASTEGGEG